MKSDPYVVVKLAGEKEKTKTVSNSSDPVWNETVKFKDVKKPASEKIRLEIWDSDTLRVRCLS